MQNLTSESEKLFVSKINTNSFVGATKSDIYIFLLRQILNSDTFFPRNPQPTREQSPQELNNDAKLLATLKLNSTSLDARRKVPSIIERKYYLRWEMEQEMYVCSESSMQFKINDQVKLYGLLSPFISLSCPQKIVNI